MRRVHLANLLPLTRDWSLRRARAALPYQNSFMKVSNCVTCCHHTMPEGSTDFILQNALIRALNIIYEVAPKVATGSHPAFQDFLEYVGVVCDMISLHIRGESRQLILEKDAYEVLWVAGDEIFFKAVAQQSKAFRSTTNKNAAVVQDALTALHRSIGGWKKVGDLE